MHEKNIRHSLRGPPREKLQQKGAQALSDQELLAILLGSGTRSHDVMNLAKRILKVMDETSANPTLDELTDIDGIGSAKATLIAAALEFARRRIRPEGFKIAFPTDVLPLIRHMADGETLGIKILDHIIFSHKGYYSFLESTN